jgi:uncharacterized coiled-coil protein SlyX
MGDVENQLFQIVSTFYAKELYDVIYRASPPGDSNAYVKNLALFKTNMSKKFDAVHFNDSFRKLVAYHNKYLPKNTVTENVLYKTIANIFTIKEYQKEMSDDQQRGLVNIVINSLIEQLVSFIIKVENITIRSPAQLEKTRNYGISALKVIRQEKINQFMNPKSKSIDPNIKLIEDIDRLKKLNDELTEHIRVLDEQNVELKHKYKKLESESSREIAACVEREQKFRQLTEILIAERDKNTDVKDIDGHHAHRTRHGDHDDRGRRGDHDDRGRRGDHDDRGRRGDRSETSESESGSESGSDDDGGENDISSMIQQDEQPASTPQVYVPAPTISAPTSASSVMPAPTTSAPTPTISAPTPTISAPTPASSVISAPTPASSVISAPTSTSSAWSAPVIPFQTNSDSDEPSDDEGSRPRTLAEIRAKYRGNKN